MITPEHVIRALQQLGFGDWAADVREQHEHFKSEAKREEGVRRAWCSALCLQARGRRGSASTAMPAAAEAPKLGKRKTMAELEGFTEAEQIEMQRRLFAEARARSMNLDAQAEVNVQAAYASAASAPSAQQQQ